MSRDIEFDNTQKYLNSIPSLSVPNPFRPSAICPPGGALGEKCLLGNRKSTQH
jgi:hypothetical protein